MVELCGFLWPDAIDLTDTTQPARQIDFLRVARGGVAMRAQSDRVKLGQPGGETGREWKRREGERREEKRGFRIS